MIDSLSERAYYQRNRLVVKLLKKVFLSVREGKVNFQAVYNRSGSIFRAPSCVIFSFVFHGKQITKKLAKLLR